MATFLAFIGGLLAASVAFLAHLSRRWQKEEQEETMKRVGAIKEALAAAREERERQARALLDAIDQKAAEDKKEDSVATANRFVLDGWDKK